VILLAAAIATAPILLHGSYCGDDFDFHVVSWFEIQRSWLHGIAFPHWMASANYGAGEPRFFFYPPLTQMLGAALGLALPWRLVPIALVFLFLAATGLANRALARQALPDGVATLAGCAALFSGFALFTAYERTAFAELAGGFWIPLLLLFALRERNSSAVLWRRALDGSTVPLALVVAGCWLSNGPLGVMGSYLLAGVALAAALAARSWAPMLRAGIGAGLGIALAGFYLPDAFVSNLIARRQGSIMNAFPDALDLLLICVESGMSVESAFAKVAAEIGQSSAELAEEFALTTAELSYLADRKQAFDNLAKRTGHPGVKQVATALNQAEHYGTPMGQALRTCAQENREMRMQEAEKKAASLPAKLTVPMILFFLPCLFVVIMGPAVMKVMKMM